MSIPPLVCSTPPPPDQCEDDKDPEDFDVQYDLSQDNDDDENYDYGAFSTYNHFQSSKTITQVENVMTKIVNNENVSEESMVDTEFVLGTNATIKKKLKLDEESIIEDLDLKIDQENANAIDAKDKAIASDTDDLKNKEAIEDIKTILPNDSLNNINRLSPQPDDSIPEKLSSEQEEELPTYVDEVIAAVEENLHVTDTDSEICPTAAVNTVVNPEPTSIETGEFEEKPVQHTDENDDFDDFDDFQFSSTSKTVNIPASLKNCNDPWGNNETADDDFGNFTANFDNIGSNVCNKSEKQIEQSPEVDSSEGKKGSEEVTEDDDFGDFNDFKSSATDTQVNASDEELYRPFLNLEIGEDQVIDSMNKIFDSIFMDDITEPEEECDDKFEAVLGETWGHMLEVENRQPYMVHWNNSLGQKTLLRALCIDSRNILFGPKWSYNMPKYAANLSVAPLQPQKQITAPVASHSEIVNLEKTISKPPSSWTDPFTSDGQESCNTDSRSENPPIEIGPTDLDVFEASTSSKPDKIFSSTLNVQPLRQISLPDTHIFTPTDSETPRSTTIHYDSSPTVLLAQSVVETNKNEPKIVLPENSATTIVSNEDDYWEFQDFKGTSNKVTPNAVNLPSETETSKTNKNVTYGTQLLQPIKIEPIIPTLNWPDPGEVKETFDDFTDFISSSSVNSLQSNTPSVKPVHQIDSKITNDFTNSDSTKLTTTPESIADDKTAETFDDEFNTFQSALPSTSSMDFNIPKMGSSNMVSDKQFNTAPQTMTDFDINPKNDNIKSEAISFETMIKPKGDFLQNEVSFFPNTLAVSKTTESVAKASPIQTTSLPMMGTNPLQPTPASSSAAMQNQKKSTQILQPLSLESYSQINWPSPGIDLQDLSRFNPVETLQSLKSDLSVNSQSKVASPAHSQKSAVTTQAADDDIWGEFVSSKPKQQAMPKKPTTTFVDDDEWTDFVSSPSVKPQNGLNTISLNVHTNIQKSNSSKFTMKTNQLSLDMPTLNYITPKSSNHVSYSDRHLQNL